MSIDDRKLDGYESYFTGDISVNLGRVYSAVLTDFPAWARRIMSLQRFKLIRAAFHPEVGASNIGDKCHQLRYALHTLDATSRATFVPGSSLSFDKGGVLSRLRFNPVR